AIVAVRTRLAEVERLASEGHPLARPERRQLIERAVAERDERLRLVRRVVLPQRMSDELRIHEDATQVRVAAKYDPKHVVGLTLEPVRAFPDGHERIEFGCGPVLFADASLDANAVAPFERPQVAHDLEPRNANPEIIDRGQVDEHVH